MEKDEIIKELTSAYEDGVFRHKEYDACKLAIKALEENDKLKAKIDILKEKNFGQSLQLAKWKDEYADLKAETEQLKAELEQSVKLPCKVGDTVYYHKTLCDEESTIVVDEFAVKHYEIYPLQKFITNEYGHRLNFKGFGKTVFLTRVEAEKALAEMESGNETN